MSAKSKKPYVVRGFDVDAEDSFDCTGVITKFGSFTEVSADRQHDAVAEMTTNSSLKTMSARTLLLANPGIIPQDPDEVREVYVVDLSVVMTDHGVTGIRSVRSDVRDVLKTWAEKSRVKGRRGWRSNAIKTPSFEFDKREGSVVMKTQVVLSTAVFYDSETACVNYSFDRSMEVEDLRNLHRALVQAAGSHYARMKYRHSVIGDGEVL